MNRYKKNNIRWRLHTEVASAEELVANAVDRRGDGICRCWFCQMPEDGVWCEVALYLDQKMATHKFKGYKYPMYDVNSNCVIK